MQTHFTAEQLQDPATRAAERILRACVHCGLCTAACPTYRLLGDELDSPRGRIYLIKDMLENDRPASETVVTHIDRCLSCLACMTACPSGVDYRQLVDHARVRIEATHRRPWRERLVRAALGRILPYRRRFQWALHVAAWARPVAAWLPAAWRTPWQLLPRVRPRAAPAASEAVTAPRPVRQRVLLLEGCVQSTLAPSITAAARELLHRLGAEVEVLTGCCGALSAHLGRDADARRFEDAQIRAFEAAAARGAVDAIAVTASGCGTHIKAYANARYASRARDIVEVVAELGLPAQTRAPRMRVAYQSPCSLRHGQRIADLPLELLRQAGFEVCEPADADQCCGSAGTYNLLQPDLAGPLRARKLAAIAALRPAVLASGNIGCMTQLAEAAGGRVVHTVELLLWAVGGPRPAGLTEGVENG